MNAPMSSKTGFGAAQTPAKKNASGPAKPKGAINIIEPKAKKSGKMTINVKVAKIEHTGKLEAPVVTTSAKKPMTRYGVPKKD